MKKTRDRKLRKRERGKGFILIAGVIIVAFLLLLAVPFLARLNTESRMIEKSYRSFIALSLAEAGVERAIWERNKGNISGWSGDNNLRTMTISNFQTASGTTAGNIQINIISPITDDPVIESRGSVPFGSYMVTRTIRVPLKHELIKPWTYAAFGSSGVVVQGNAKIDSWDSRLGTTYEAQKGAKAYADNQGNIGTNATGGSSIYVWGNCDVYGNAYCGPTGDPNTAVKVGGSSNIQGKAALSQPVVLPPVDPPVGLSGRGDFDQSADIQEVGESFSGIYNTFQVKGGKTLKVTGNVVLWVKNRFTLWSLGNINVEPGGSLTIYVGRDDVTRANATFEVQAGSTMNNNSKDPTKCQILATEGFNGTMSFKANVNLYGAIYAPQAIVDLQASTNVWGSVTGNYVTCRADCTIHYDKALENLGVRGNDGTPFVVASWHEKI